MRVNLIRSILVFQEKKYCLHDNVKLVFLKKIYTKTIHTKIIIIIIIITRTVQVNCTVRVNSANSAIHLHCSRQCKWIALCTWIQKLKKQPGAASPMSRSKRELAWVPPVIFSVFDITKHYVCCGCFKRKRNHANKRPLRP